MRHCCKYLLGLGISAVGILEGFSKEYKNVVFILADDMGADLSAYGVKSIYTPNIDSLINNGVSFLNAFSTCASSAPSRGSILTGMYPHSNGHWRNTHSLLLSDPDECFAKDTEFRDIVGVYEEIKTLPEVLSSNNVYSAIMRKYHLSYPWKFQFSARMATPNNVEGYYKDISTILEKAGDSSCFMMANLTPPHRPWNGIVKSYKGYLPDKSLIEIPSYLPDVPEIREEFYRYYINIMYTDQLVGSILKALKDKSQFDDTLIIFSADQGPAFHRAKASAYYAGTHVPLVFSGKGIKHSIRKELVSLVDLMPTILDYLDIDAEEQFQGKSLRKIIENAKDDNPRKYVYTTHNSHGPSFAEFYPSRAIFDGRYYLIENLLPEKKYKLPDDLCRAGKPWFNLSYDAVVSNKDKYPSYYEVLNQLLNGRPKYELYDMFSDPSQLVNLSGNKNYSKIEITLKNELSKWRKETGDTDEKLKEMMDSFGKKIPFVNAIKKNNNNVKK